MGPSYPDMRHHVFAYIVFLALGSSANEQDDDFEPVDLPDNIAGRVEGFDQETIDFLRDESALNFDEWQDILLSRLEDKLPVALTPEDLVAGNVEVAIMGIAMLKRGLTEPHYLCPLTVDHEHDQ